MPSEDSNLSVDDIDWGDLESQFQLLSDIPNVCSENDFDAYKASLSHPDKIQSPLKLKLSYGVLPVRSRSLLFGALASLRSSGPNDEIPPHLRKYFPDHVAVVRDGIARRQLTPGFVNSWGQLKVAAAIVETLSNMDKEVSESRLLAGLAKAEDCTLQKYWYAWWIKNSGAKKAKERLEENDKIATLCADIVARRRTPLKFEQEWFEMMLREDSRKENSDSFLATTYTRLPHNELERMTGNALISKDVLPPLDIRSFPQI